MVGRKVSLANPKHQYHVSQLGEHDCGAIMSRKEIIISIEACLMSQINFNYKENGGRKNFSCKSKASISCFPMGRT